MRNVEAYYSALVCVPVKVRLKPVKLTGVAPAVSLWMTWNVVECPVDGPVAQLTYMPANSSLC